MIESNKVFNFSDAIQSLYPNFPFTIYGNDYNRLEWYDESTEKPTKEELELEIVRLQKQYEANEYQRLRAAEYPDYREFLDAFVKGDMQQLREYRQACMNIKLKYPKSNN